MSRLQDGPVKSEREAGMGLDWRQRQGEQAGAIIATQPRQRERAQWGAEERDWIYRFLRRETV